MKITELKCTACNGTLKMDEKNPHMAVCEYCRTRYLLEDEGEGNVRLASEPGKIWYEPASQPAKKPSGWGAYGWKRVTAVLLLGLLILAVFYGPRVKKRWDMNRQAAVPVKSSQENSVAYQDGTDQQAAEAEGAEIKLTGCLGDMASAALGKPPEALTREDLSSIQWLEYKYTADYVMLGYSMEAPGGSGEASLIWMEFPRDNAELNISQLSSFTGLKALSAAGYLSSRDIKGLKLESLGCYAKKPEDLESLLEDPTQLRELKINAGLDSLEGIGAFSGLERLSIDCDDLADVKPLVNMKGLKSLTIENGDEINDFSVFSVMNWLEELSIDSEGLKDIGFIKSNPSLQSLSIENASILDVNPLVGNSSLSSLKVESCGEVKDLTAISGLTALKELSLEVPYNCPQPDLSGLGGLERLKIEGMDTVTFLQNMPSLKSLELEACSIDSGMAFKSLGALKNLKCSRISDETDWGFVASISGLEILDLRGVTTYRDISGIFSMPSLKALYLNGVECELDFSKLTPNESLEILELDGVKLYKNVQISGEGGFRYIDWDDVSLDEHTDFLTNYPGLKALSLSDNKLTHISFASGLPNLESLDISDNYVTDLKPLESLTRLRTLNCQGNPIENYRVLPEDVMTLSSEGPCITMYPNGHITIHALRAGALRAIGYTLSRASA